MGGGWERVIRTKSLSSYYPEQIDYIYDYTYDERGNLIRKKVSTMDHSFSEMTRGNKTFKGADIRINIEDYVYDDQNRRIQKSVYWGYEYINEQYEVMDYKMDWETYNYSYEYDEKNRLIQITEANTTPGYRYYLYSAESSPVLEETSSYVSVGVVTYTY